ncbi:alanine racemase [Nocardioides speluncae]|uniref:alanine racemase n=1 Tax=Nocardioides speluncae TaxID=2670337 RepID=UPI000D687672|nr:alanine racemase [Nocardioides speluncae]
MTLSKPYGPARTLWPDLLAATEHLDPPFAVLDLAAVRTNAHQLVRRAAGKPIRVASKSIRVRSVIRDALEVPGMSGILAYTLPEALWLAEDHEDVVVGYPTTHREALRRLAKDDELASRVTLMIDSAEHLDLTAEAVGADSRGGPPIRICLELDVSLRLAGGRVHLGARRSPVHSPEDAAALARRVVAHPRFELVGLMGYEGQIAGLGDNQPGLRRFAVRAMQARSAAELAERRAAAVAAVRQVAPLEFVNGGGTGSLELTAAEDAVTEVAAGSGLFAPRLFDFYTRFRPEPAAYFVLSVVRRPSPQHATVLGGGWVASGAAGKDRLPTPVWPEGLSLVDQEGAGEVQTPLVGDRVDELGIGDHVWFRHTKAGELSEHVDEVHLVEGNRIVDVVPTYRGEGKTFL